mmetsp:Transcript_151186/g.263481  ORF Transcript_151186/g.263481 Transcript_151186/m.263481 type:complete len:679 (-) Transcript_151186:40-2076(-)
MSRRSRSLSDEGSGYKLVPLDEDQEVQWPTTGLEGMPWPTAGMPESFSHPQQAEYITQGIELARLEELGRAQRAGVAASSAVDTLLEHSATSHHSWLTIDYYLFHSWQDFLNSTLVQTTTVILIFGNAIIIGFETDMPNLLEWDYVENGFLVAFTVELALKMYASGAQRFFQLANNPDLTWNLFDFSIVAFGLLNVLAAAVLGGEGKVGKDATLFRMIRLLRILRVLRIIRIVRFLKQLYLLAYGFMEGTMAVFWVTLLASFALYICAVILVRTYGRIAKEDDPNSEFFVEHFGNIPRTMFNLFELLAAPDLVPYRAIMFKYPPLVVFLVSFIILGSFGINGLLVALINESILEKNQARLEADRIERESKRKIMQQRCREVFDAIDVNKNRVLPRSEIMKCKGAIMQLFETSGVNFRSHDLDQMFYIMDYNDTGIIERNEFVQGVVELCDQIRPMSIMELHYQVSKCASKVESCDAKMDGVVKAVEDVGVSGRNTMAQAEHLVARLSEMLDRQQEHEDSQALVQRPLAGGVTNVTYTQVGLPHGLPPSLQSRTAPASAPLSFRDHLNGLLDALSDAQARTEAVLMSVQPLDASRMPQSELADLGATFFRLQGTTTEVLETLYTAGGPPSKGSPGSAGISVGNPRIDKLRPDALQIGARQAGVELQLGARQGLQFTSLD